MELSWTSWGENMRANSAGTCFPTPKSGPPFLWGLRLCAHLCVDHHVSPVVVWLVYYRTHLLLQLLPWTSLLTFTAVDVFGTRNWSRIATHLVLVFLLVGATSSKIKMRFGWNLRDCSLSPRHTETEWAGMKNVENSSHIRAASS